MYDAITIGNPIEFAIKFQIMPHSIKNYGLSQIIIKNIPIGTWDDNEYLIILSNSLERVRDLSNNRYLKAKFDKLNTEAAFNRLSKNNYGSLMLLGFGENFDDFDLRVFQYKQRIFFLWRLYDKPYFSYDASLHYKIFYESVSVDRYKKVLHEFKSKLNL